MAQIVAGEWTDEQKGRYLRAGLEDLIERMKSMRVLLAFEDENERNAFIAAYGRARTILDKSAAATKEEMARNRRTTR